jgi:tRNA 2-selenouridine synthase
MTPQPTTEQFQNDLFEEVLKLNPDQRVWIEDDFAVGKIFCHRSLVANGSQSGSGNGGRKGRKDWSAANEYSPSTPTIGHEQDCKNPGRTAVQRSKGKLLQGDMATTIDTSGVLRQGI